MSLSLPSRPLDLFNANLDRIRTIHAIHEYLDVSTTQVLETDDLLRTEIVLLISALDHYVHEITRALMIEVADGQRPATDSFLKFPVALKVALSMGVSERAALIEAEVRDRHGHLSFQRADAIADAIRLVSPIELWNVVGDRLGTTSRSIKAELNLIVARRNQIAHEADLNPSFPGEMWPIDSDLVTAAVETVSRIVEAIDAEV